jgi:hypothetical protein
VRTLIIRLVAYWEFMKSMLIGVIQRQNVGGNFAGYGLWIAYGLDAISPDGRYRLSKQVGEAFCGEDENKKDLDWVSRRRIAKKLLEFTSSREDDKVQVTIAGVR